MASEEINVKELEGHRDKIKELMRRDPKFIGRLITVSQDLCTHQQLRKPRLCNN